MEPFFPDPNLQRFPPAETRLVDLQAELTTDVKRIRVNIEMTPFLQRPTIELVLLDSSGEEVSAASIIEPVGWKLEINLHIRKLPSPLPPSDASGKIESSASSTAQYLLTASLVYPDLGEVDRRQVTVRIENH